MTKSDKLWLVGQGVFVFIALIIVYCLIVLMFTPEKKQIELKNIASFEGIANIDGDRFVDEKGIEYVFKDGIWMKTKNH